MNKKSIGILTILGIVILGVSISMNSEEKDDNIVFHVTLADPELYTNGIYTNNFTVESGTYFFRFVPNGSSPEILRANDHTILINISPKNTCFCFLRIALYCQKKRRFVC